MSHAMANFSTLKNICLNTSKALFALSNVFNNNTLFVQDKLKQLIQLFYLFLCMAVRYGNFYKSDDIEKVHMRFLKQVLGIRKQTSNIAVYGELRRFLLIVLRKIRILKYWFKILNAPESLLYKVYLQQVNQLNINANFECWAAGIHKLLNELGFSYLSDFQILCKLQLDMVIQTIYDQYCQSWSNKLDTLKGVNKVFSFEKYISCISIEIHKVAPSRFR